MAAGGYSAGRAYVSVLPSLARDFQTRIRAEIKANFPGGLTIDVTPKFDPGAMKAQAGAAARGAGQTVRFRAELDRKSLASSIVGVAALSRAMRTLTLPGGLVAATPYVLSFASSVTRATGAAALMPAVLTAGGVAAGTFAVGLSGVADTFKELAKADEAAATTATTAAKARRAALESVRSATAALEDSQRSADRAAEQGAEQVADRRRAVTEAITAGARQTEAAQEDLARSEERARLSREALTRAYKEGREELQQLQFSIEGAGLAEEAAADRLDEARARLAEARAQGAGAEEISDLDREVREADLALRQAADRYGDLKAEGLEWARTGISGSQGVAAAQREVDEAERAVLASREALTRAEVEGDAAVAEARRELGRTIVAVGRQQEDSARAVERASLALTQAQDAAGEAGSAAGAKAALAYASLSPAARELVTQVRALGPAWTGMRLDVQDRLLAGIGTRINTLGGTYIPVLNSALGLTADGYNRAAHATLDWLAQASTTADVRRGLDNVALGISNSSGAMQPLLAAFTDFVVVGSEFLPAMGTSLTNNAIRFREFVAEARESGRIREWIQGGLDTLKQLWQLTKNTGGIVKSTLDAARGSGEDFLATLVRLSGSLNRYLKTPEGAAGLREFFTTVRTLVGLFIDRVVQLWPLISSAAGAFAALLVALSPVSSVLLGIVTTLLPPLLDLIGFLAPVIAPVIAAYTAWTVVMKAQVLWTNLLTASTKLWNLSLRANPIGIVVTALAALVAGLIWAYQNVEWFRNLVDGAWRVIASVSTWLWTKVLKPVFDAFVWLIKNVTIPAVLFLWHKVIEPAFTVMGALVKFWWNTFVKPPFDAFVWLITNVTIPAILFLWRRVIEPGFTGMGAIISGVWRHVIKPAWDALIGGLGYVRDRFTDAVGFIGRKWDELRGFLARPINAVIRTVFNQGIIRAWNFAADLLPGIGRVKPLQEFRWATGGQIPGTGSKDTVPSLLTPGEWVIRKPVAERHTDFLAALNAGQPEAVQAAGGRNGRFAHFAAGGPVERGLAFAREQHGRPYIWGGVGPRGYDCSGFISAIANVLLGRNPHRRLGTTGSAPWPGWVRGLTSAFGVGYFKGDPGHMAGTLAGHNVESGGSPSRVKFVQGAAGARSGQFRAHMSLPQVGGEFVGGGDSGWNPIPGLIRSFVERVTDPLINALPSGPPRFLDIPAGLGRRVRDSVLDFLVGTADAQTGAVPGAGPVRRQVQAVAHRFGWGAGRQWGALDWLIGKESSWNPLAQNPRSTAYGLYQFLDSTWATVGGRKTANPGLQAEYGNRYIRQRYGDPAGAQRFHQAHNWYDFGGYLMPGAGGYFNGTGMPELVLPPTETRAYDTLSRLISSGRLTVGSDDGQTGGVVTNHTWNVYESSDAAETALKIQRRQEMATRTGAPL